MTLGATVADIARFTGLHLYYYSPIIVGVIGVCVLAYLTGRGSRIATGLLVLVAAVVVFHVATDPVAYRNIKSFAALFIVAGMFNHRGRLRREAATVEAIPD